jgi:hypothetical protein
MCFRGFMSRWKSSSLAAFAAALALLPGPAMAQTATASDPAGDATGRGLDVTRITVSNDDRRVVVRTRFVKAQRGDLIVFLDPRGRQRGVGLVSEYRPKGTTKNYILSSSTPRRSCDGFRVVWRPARNLVRMTMPSRCQHRGDYGALRFAFLTERNAADIDFSSDWSEFIPRG